MTRPGAGGGARETAGERLGVELTTRCNGRCTYCFVRARGAPPSSLPAGLVRACLREGRALSYRHLHLTGGEPLLWDGIADLVDHAFSLGFESVLLNTNGTLLAGDRLHRLAARAGVILSVSLQGPEPFHDRVRGPGTYRLAARGVQAALDAGLRVVVFATVFRSLLPDLPSFAEQLYARFPGVHHLRLIQLIRAADGVPGLADELLDPDGFLRLVRTVSLLNLAGLRTGVLNNPLAVAASRRMGMPWVPPSDPLFRDGSLFVRADREVTLAHSTLHGLGAYRPGKLGEVLSSRAYRDAVGPDRRTCPACRFAGDCRAAGLARPSGPDRDMDAGAPFCRKTTRKRVTCWPSSIVQAIPTFPRATAPR